MNELDFSHKNKKDVPEQKKYVCVLMWLNHISTGTN